MSSLSSLTTTLPLSRVDRVHAAFAEEREGGSSYPSVFITRQQWESLGAPTELKVTMTDGLLMEAFGDESRGVR